MKKISFSQFFPLWVFKTCFSQDVIYRWMCFSQFFPLWVSKTCFSQDGIYRYLPRLIPGTVQNPPTLPWCETLRKWVNWMLCWLGYLWPWIFKVKLYFGNGRPDCHGMKGTGDDSMPRCETQPLCDPRQRILLPTGWLKMSAFPSTRLVLLYYFLSLDSPFLLILGKVNQGS